ncbi:hypothetical protein [Photobacterium satsumensis]|uniref:hypothetical protein n=1 Tax=Photobacterium satsumensis TaxID=2910239 RepID=UPI003D0FFF36
MNKELIAITAASTILAGCASTQTHDEILYSNQFQHTHSESHSDAMNVMMMAYDIEPKNPNNLDEFTGDYHSRLARRSNVTGSAFTAMSLLGGAGLGSSLLTGAVHSPTDQMVTPIKYHSVVRVLPMSSQRELEQVRKQNRRDVLQSLKVSLDSLGYSTTHYQHNLSRYMNGMSGSYSESMDILVRNDLEQCVDFHNKLSDGSFKNSDIIRSTQQRNLFFSCSIIVEDTGSRIVNLYDSSTNEAKPHFVWTNWTFLDVSGAWHVEAYNALSMDSNTYLYSPSFYWLTSRNNWAQVDVETMDRAIEHGVITPTPRLKVLDGSNTVIPFSLDEA